MEDDSQSQSLSILLQEMAEAGVSDDVLPATQSQSNILNRAEEDWMKLLTKPFNVIEFLIPASTNEVLKEWYPDYRIPASSSAEVGLHSSSIDEFGLNTLAGQVESQNLMYSSNHKEPEKDGKTSSNKQVSSPPNARVRSHQNQTERSCWQDCMDSIQLSDKSLDIGKPDAHSGSLVVHQTLCCWYSFALSHQDDSNEYPQHRTERSCWQDCMDSVQLSDESLDIGQPDAHSTQVDRGSGDQDCVQEQDNSSGDDSADILGCSSSNDKSNKQSSSIELVEKDNSIIIVLSSGSENNGMTVSRKSSDELRQCDQKELQRLVDLSGKKDNISGSTNSEFSQSALYRTSIIDKHLNSLQKDCIQADKTSQQPNKGSEDLFKDSSTTVEQSGKSVNKDSTDSNNGITLSPGEQDHQNSDMSSDMVSPSQNERVAVRAENKENENSQNHVATQNPGTKTTGLESFLDYFRKPIQKLSKRPSKAIAKSNGTQNKSYQSSQDNVQKSSQKSVGSSPLECSSDVDAMSMYYSQSSPEKPSRKLRQTVSKQNKTIQEENDKQLVTRLDTQTNINDQTLNGTSLGRTDSEKDKTSQTSALAKHNEDTSSLSLHTDYEFTEIDKNVNTETDTKAKKIYMSSLELSPVQDTPNPVDMSEALGETTDNSCQNIDMNDSTSPESSHSCDSKSYDAEIIFARRCQVVLERLSDKVINSFKHAEKSKKNDVQLHSESLQTSSNEIKTSVCKTVSKPKNGEIRKAAVPKMPKSKEKPQSPKRVKTAQNKSKIDEVCGTQPFNHVVGESQGFVPMAEDGDIYGNVILSDCDVGDNSNADSSSIHKATNREKDMLETGVLTPSVSGHFINVQTSRKATINKLKLKRKQQAQEVGFDIDSIFSKDTNHDKEDGTSPKQPVKQKGERTVKEDNTGKMKNVPNASNQMGREKKNQSETGKNTSENCTSENQVNHMSRNKAIVDKNQNELKICDHETMAENDVEVGNTSDDSYESIKIPFNCEGRGQISTKNLNINKRKESPVKLNPVVSYKGDGKGTSSMKNNRHKRKLCEILNDKQKVDIHNEDSGRKRVCSETHKQGVPFACSDAEMDYLLSKCPSNNEVLDCAKTYSSVRNLPNTDSILISLFPVMKVLDKEFRIKPVNKRTNKRNNSNDDSFCIPLKKLKRVHSRPVPDDTDGESEESLDETKQESEAEDDVGLFDFLYSSKATKQSTPKCSRKPSTCINEPSPSTSRCFPKSPDKLTNKHQTVCVERESSPYKLTNKDKNGSVQNQTDTGTIVRSNLRLTVDKSTGACRFSRAETAGKTNDKSGPLDPDTQINVAKSKGKQIAVGDQNAESDIDKSKTKHKCDKKESGKTKERDVTNENKETKHNNQITANEPDVLNSKSKRNDKNRNQETEHPDNANEIVKTKKSQNKKNDQINEVKKHRGTKSKDLSETKNSLRDNSRHTTVNRKTSEIKTTTLTRAHLKATEKVDKDSRLKEWLLSTSFQAGQGSSSDDDN